MKQPNDTGTRTVIEVPGLGRCYLLAMPHAKEDHFIIKIPYENRAEHEKWRLALDTMLDVVNGHVSAIHKHYQERFRNG